MTIRKATRADGDAAIELLRGEYLAAGFDRADNETGFAFEFQPERARALFDFHSQSPTSVCLVLDVEGVARGLLMASFADHPFCGARVAYPQGWFIQPGFRGRNAFRMLDAYEAWAREKGCAFIGAATMAEDEAGLAILYTRRGYRKAEAYFMKAL